MNFDYKEDNYDFNVDMPNETNVFEKYIYKNSIPTIEGTETNPIDALSLESGNYLVKGNFTFDNIESGYFDGNYSTYQLINVKETILPEQLGGHTKLFVNYSNETDTWQLIMFKYNNNVWEFVGRDTFATNNAIDGIYEEFDNFYTKSEVDSKVISTLEGTTSNPINAWELEEGIYIIKGTYFYKPDFFRTKLTPQFLRVEVVESGGQTIKMVSNDEFEIDGYTYSNGSWTYLQTINMLKEQFYTKSEIDNMIGNIETLLGGI